MVIEAPAAAAAALDPMRARLLAELREPASAATLATKVGLTRQKVNYHLRQLETHGLVRGGRAPGRGAGSPSGSWWPRPRATSCRPRLLGDFAADPGGTPTGFRWPTWSRWPAGSCASSGAWRATRRAQGTTLPAMGIDTAIRFATPADRAAFADDLTAAVTRLAADLPRSRRHRRPVAAAGRGRASRSPGRRARSTVGDRHDERRHDPPLDDDRSVIPTSEGGHLRSVEIELEATPAQVWEAIATAGATRAGCSRPRSMAGWAAR